MQTSEVFGFIFRALGGLGEQILKAIDGGDLETTDELTKWMPERERMLAQSLALKAQQAKKAGV